MAADAKTFGGWAILELMGHRRLAGYVTEVELAGAGFFRLDVPDRSDEETSAGPVTQFYSPSSVYALTPTTEEIARSIHGRPQLVHAFELPERRGRALELAAQDVLDDDEGIEF